tara:strand:- start:2429 stop:2596 length:168 start_codon:yes stop_codon:yes gene_type:complete
LLLGFVSLSTGCGASNSPATINDEGERPQDASLDPSFYSDEANADPNAPEKKTAK